jgi:hypothetical protein
MPDSMLAVTPSGDMRKSRGARVNVLSSQCRTCCRSACGTPSIVVMISTGNRAEKSATASKECGSSRSAYSVTLARIIGSSAATDRGVNTLFTSLRIFVWSGGSIMMTSAGMSGFGSSMNMSRLTPLAEEYVSQSFSAGATSLSYRDSAQKPYFSE